MPERRRIPGARDVSAVVDVPDSGVGAVVVAAPPHPQLGGSRSDPRLRALGTHLTAAGVACCRFDYGPWDEGRGEVTDARSTLAWAAEDDESVALFGYSFGGAVALLAAVDPPVDLVAVSTLAPVASLGPDRDAVAAVDAIDCPLQVVYGERDETAEWEPVVAAARRAGQVVESLPADHHFVGQTDAVAELVGSFLLSHVRT